MAQKEVNGPISCSFASPKISSSKIYAELASVGILVALAVTAVWSEHQPESAKQNTE